MILKLEIKLMLVFVIIFSILLPGQLLLQLTQYVGVLVLRPPIELILIDHKPPILRDDHTQTILVLIQLDNQHIEHHMEQVVDSPVEQLQVVDVAFRTQNVLELGGKQVECGPVFEVQERAEECKDVGEQV